MNRCLITKCTSRVTIAHYFYLIERRCVNLFSKSIGLLATRFTPVVFGIIEYLSFRRYAAEARYSVTQLRRILQINAEYPFRTVKRRSLIVFFIYKFVPS